MQSTEMAFRRFRLPWNTRSIHCKWLYVYIIIATAKMLVAFVLRRERTHSCTSVYQMIIKLHRSSSVSLNRDLVRCLRTFSSYQSQRNCQFPSFGSLQLPSSINEHLNTNDIAFTDLPPNPLPLPLVAVLFSPLFQWEIFSVPEGRWGSSVVEP